MVKTSNWEKFKLLLWKNWIIQLGNKYDIMVDLLIPIVLSILLVYARIEVDVRLENMITYSTYDLSDLSVFKKSIGEQSTNKMPKYQLVYSPNTKDAYKAIMESASKTLQLNDPQGYANAADLEFALKSDNYLAGVQFDDNAEYPKKLSFSLRFPAELRTSEPNLAYTWLTKRLLEPYLLKPGSRNRDDSDGGLPVGYLREGFLPIQNAITTAHLNMNKANKNIVLPNVLIQRYPYPDYIFDPLLMILKLLFVMIFIFFFFFACVHLVKNITTEKEHQLKELLKIIGLQNWIHWTAFFLMSFIIMGISAIIFVTLMKIKWVNDVAVFTHSSYTVLLFVMLVYISTTIFLCFMVVSLFDKATTAVTVFEFIIVVCIFPTMAVTSSYDNLSLGDKLSYCLLPPSAIGLGLRIICSFEQTGEGVQWNNLFSPVSVDDSLMLGYVIMMMLCSGIICLLVCLYIEQVFPGEYGVARKWNFPFTSSFWCGEKEYLGVEDTSNDVEQRIDDAFEAEPSGKQVGVQVKNLKKKFGDLTVVKGVSMNMYEDEITVLLGHNGAGKTTTISMLTGMFSPTEGTAIINGSDIRTNIDGARKSMGICPQHNVLFDVMSVANHIVFFSRVKGLKGEAVQKEVDKYLKMIALEDKANVASSKLSGGMKRKLSMCCALCGGSKVVFCDEPSSGMDPSARRQLWDLLQAEKAGRTMLLTTHFMDEADVLGDRIAIMCDGEIKCHGTSFFLKKKYGTGYHLICVKLENCNTIEVTALLSQFIPGIKPKSEIGAELTYELPDSFTDVFEEMFRALEEKSEELHLNGYGIGITSMEEVFLKVGEENASDGSRKQQSSVIHGGTGNPEDDLESIKSDRMFSENTRLLKGADLYLNQWRAMFLKKFICTLRKKILFFLQNIIPILFLIVTVISSRNQRELFVLSPMTMSLDQYPTLVTVLDVNYTALNPLSTSIGGYYEKIVKSYGSDYALELTKDKSFSNFILKLGKTLQAKINSYYLVAASIGEDTIVAWFNNQPLHTAPLSLNLVHNAMAKALIDPNAEIKVTNFPLPYTTDTMLKQLNSDGSLGKQLSMNISMGMCFVTAFYAIFLIKERESRFKLLQFVGGVRIWIFWAAQFLWDLFTFTLITLLVIITIACFQETGFLTFSELGRYFLILILFEFSVLPFTYLLSFIFSNSATGFDYIVSINMFSGALLFMIVKTMSLEEFGKKDTMDKWQWLYHIFPHYSLAMGCSKLYENGAIREACSNEIIVNLPEDLRCQLVPKCCTVTPYFDWKHPGVLNEVVYMFGSSVVFFLIIFMHEYRLVNQFIYGIKTSLIRTPPLPKDDFIDDDVQNEKQRILDMSSNEIAGQNLVLDRVTKFYGKFLSVNQISVCVKQTECFGLLGVNGAGKTTIFKMMTGDERITSGAAYVKGISLKTNMTNVYKEIGYCPQFDALLDDLTGRETLMILFLVCGMHKNGIAQISEELGKSFGFMEHMDKKTKAYSGGNKRKLSTAIAMIGSPSVIYLDEPTTGIDPAARRKLWNMVCRIRDSGKSIVLTTHSMEECEAMCTRLAIMVNGEFKCIGSTQHLKNKFSKGLILKIKVKRSTEQSDDNNNANGDEGTVSKSLAQQDIQNVKQFVEDEFPQAILQDEYQGLLTFYIPLASIKWSEIFGIMEDSRIRLNIEDYSISQTSLEEIFLEFSKSQREKRPAV